MSTSSRLSKVIAAVVLLISCLVAVVLVSVYARPSFKAFSDSSWLVDECRHEDIRFIILFPRDPDTSMVALTAIATSRNKNIDGVRIAYTQHDTNVHDIGISCIYLENNVYAIAVPSKKVLLKLTKIENDRLVFVAKSSQLAGESVRLLNTAGSEWTLIERPRDVGIPLDLSTE